MRATSSRRWQRVELASDHVTVWQSTTTGMGVPATWELVENISAPAKVRVASTDDATHIAVGAAPADGAGLPGAVDFAPDGTAQSFTAFLAGTVDETRRRIIVYRATGATYVLEDW